MTIPEPLVNGTGGAMLWGVLSVLVNPCHFVTIPLLIGLIEKAGACESIRKAGWLSFVFSVGMGAVTLVAGVLLLLFGRGLGCSRWADVILALVIICAGLNIMGILDFGGHLHWHRGTPSPKAEPLRFLLLGAIWGAAHLGCNMAHFIPVMGASLRLSNRLLPQLLVSTAYAIGQMGVLVACGCFTERLHRIRDWHHFKPFGLPVRVICGVIVVLFGFWTLLRDHEAHGEHHHGGEPCPACCPHGE
ncbi:MAG: hypothetical protein SPK06_00350 [Kiritimatiellia bacterium]|nr:hypothetical protein [Kiritimatiellia bacterium]